MSEYIPTEQDLIDFREFSEERDKIEKLLDTKRTKSVFYEITKGSTKQLVMRGALLDQLSCMLSVVDKIESYALLERLNLIEMLGYDKREIIKIISPDLSEADIDALLENKSYPYLYIGLQTYLGNNRLELAQEAMQKSIKYGTLPFIAFLEPPYLLDSDLVYVKRELIHQTDSSARPKYGIRSQLLKMGSDLHYWKDIDYDTNKQYELSAEKFLRVLCDFCRDWKEFLRYQFGIITTTSGVGRNKIMFSIAIKYIPLISEYFNVKLKYRALRRGQHYLSVLLDKKK